MPNCIISVSDKTNLDILCNYILEKGYTIYSTGGTYKYIVDNVDNKYHQNIISITKLTGFPEILGGRVKTLHPKIYGGLLCDRDNESHLENIKEHDITQFSLVVVNLYPFQKQDMGEIDIENIDIGGVSLIRASSKNYKYISILTSPTQYDDFMVNSNHNLINLIYRKNLAKYGFEHTFNYDKNICEAFHLNCNNNEADEPSNKMIKYELKYGLNPHQKPSYFEYPEDSLTIINGNLGYINVLDFIHGWLMAREIEDATKYICFLSMKHTSPAGAGIGNDILQETMDIFGVDKYTRDNMTPCARAYIKSRNSDPLSSFGDFICCSSNVDTLTAELIKKEVCDGIIAVDFSVEALEILKSKKGGKFIIIKMDLNYYQKMNKEGWQDKKEIYGMTLSQPYNDYIPKLELLNIDGIMAYSILKYSQSNNVSMVYNGQLLGLGCGQQNRVGCVKLAGEKALIWRLRNHPKTIEYYKSLDSGLKRQEKVNLVYDFIYKNRKQIQSDLNNIELTLGSDGFFPFVDNIIEAKKFGVCKIIQPGGSIMDDSVKEECDKLGITMVNIGKRMFYH